MFIKLTNMWFNLFSHRSIDNLNYQPNLKNLWKDSSFFLYPLGSIPEPAATDQYKMFSAALCVIWYRLRIIII